MSEILERDDEEIMEMKLRHEIFYLLKIHF